MPDTYYVMNEDPQFFVVSYEDNGDLAKRAALAAQWKKFDRQEPSTGNTYRIWYRPTSPNLQVTVDYVLSPQAPSGRYRIETYIPGRHATAKKALYTVASNFRVVSGQVTHDEPVVVINQLDIYDKWQPLGEYFLEPGVYSTSGRVRQFDLSPDNPVSEVSCGPVRWVPLFMTTPTPPAAGGEMPSTGLRFDAPIGTEAERNVTFPAGRLMFNKLPVWVGDWFDVNPYLTWYEYGYHTGADLNLPGASGADKGKPIYAVADGTVTYAGSGGTWGYIIVIEHADALVTKPYGVVERQKVYSRYGHVDKNILVKIGQVVKRGQQIASIGLAEGAQSGWHLHFDVSYTDLLLKRPAHWPNLTRIRDLQSSSVSVASEAYKKAQAAVMKEVVSHYLDPLRFIKENHTI